MTIQKEEKIMDADGIRRTLMKIAYEILSRNKGPKNLVILGLQTRGVFLANRIASIIKEIEQVTIPVGILDVTMYRDDFRMAMKQPTVQVTSIPYDVDGTNIVLVDDVFYTGRTIRAALDAIMDFGRPKRVRFAALIDRGHRELPFCADFIGKTIKTQVNQEIRVRLTEVEEDGIDEVSLITFEDGGGRMTAFGLKHLFGLKDVSKKDINVILDTADSFREVMERPIRIVPTLKGVAVLNLFYEDSTRTRISFELAEKRLSAEVTTFAKGSSSVSKGESLRDTVRNIEAMKIDIIVSRHKSPGTPQFLAAHTNCRIINAGDGAHEHPTQALLDMMTMRRHFGKLDGLRVLIVGDILHSRVARSEIWGLKTMGASVDVCGPASLMPCDMSHFGISVHYDFDAVLPEYDVIYMLRIQKERQSAALIPSNREYTTMYGLAKDRMSRMKKDAVIMHPGPINRGIELDYEVADSERSLILEQVTNGEAVRMAVLFLLSGRM